VTYTIEKASISTCTVTAVSKYFNYEKQRPSEVHVFDAAGNEVDSSQYTWDVDSEKWADTTSKGYYLNAQDANTTTGYPVIITATATGNYSGTQTAEVFKIKPVSFASSADTSDNPNQSTLQIGNIVWAGQTWDFMEVSDMSTNNAIGSASKRGTMKIKYTGSAIKPTLTGITYCGQSLLEIKDGDKWYSNTKAYGYKILYGNANPELGTSSQVDSYDESVTNVTGTNYASMTIRSAPYSNFDNYVTVWFEITPASLSSDCTLSNFADTVAYAGATAKQNATFTYNGMTLVEGRDYLATYERVDETHMQVTYTGRGNYNGTVTRTYSTTGQPQTYADVNLNSDWFVTDGYFDYVVTNGIIGVGVSNYDANSNVTRAQLVTMLWRLAGCQAATAARTFSDVPSSHWASSAIAWASSEGIVSGYGDTGRFGPEDPVTREQASKMISTFAQYMGIDISADETVLDTRADGAQVASYARPYLAWCMNAGIIGGYTGAYGKTYLNPQGNTTRAQMTKIICVLMRDVLTKQA
jgi:hypothetical protein